MNYIKRFTPPRSRSLSPSRGPSVPKSFRESKPFPRTICRHFWPLSHAPPVSLPVASGVSQFCPSFRRACRVLLHRFLRFFGYLGLYLAASSSSFASRLPNPPHLFRVIITLISAALHLLERLLPLLHCLLLHLLPRSFALLLTQPCQSICLLSHESPNNLCGIKPLARRTSPSEILRTLKHHLAD